MKQNVFRALSLLMALPLFVACPFMSEEYDSEQEVLTLLALPVPLQINGDWIDNFGTTHNIQATRTPEDGVTGDWNQSGSGNTTYAHVVAFDNAAGVLYKYVTGCTTEGWCTLEYSRVFWTYSAGNYYYCDENYGKPTLQDAMEDPIDADPADLEHGCAGFSWNKLTRL